MTERIAPNLANVEKLVAGILMPILAGKRVAFLVPNGEGFNTCARIRTHISRTRKKLMARNIRPMRFTLMSTIHKETWDGKRYDCIVMWRHVTPTNEMTQELEDLLAHG